MPEINFAKERMAFFKSQKQTASSLVQKIQAIVSAIIGALIFLQKLHLSYRQQLSPGRVPLATRLALARAAPRYFGLPT
jgi:hypothetical protein